MKVAVFLTEKIVVYEIDAKDFVSLSLEYKPEQDGDWEGFHEAIKKRAKKKEEICPDYYINLIDR